MFGAQIKEFIIDNTTEGLRPFIGQMDFEPAAKCWCGGQPEPWTPEFALYLRCPSCGCKPVRFRPTTESLQRFYSSTYWYEYQQVHKCPTVEERFEGDMLDRVPLYLNWLRGLHPPPCKVLEIGSGNGRLLFELKQAGYDCTGVEMDKNLAALVTNKTGVTVVHGSFPPGNDPIYDLIVIIDVLEHAPDQINFVQNVKSRLSSSGKVLVHCPVLDTLEASIQFRHMFNPLSHLWIHTSESFSKLWLEAGLRSAKVGELFNMPVYAVNKL
ncbi:class I SAM-dependent methyltransferase [Candidatus Magnetominusculus xianensis]|uniref:Methyltransferase n=1 Tax=Candidatus Magnetominusculus xianensis TaxID=1748249 RepID=A0ABR5SG81_9BACT|nr:class I SAM-dependent methyltransferase [Candidatus Magnetominusculus xianensis]KWT84060.1 methyltransferase [Candidatus Magnetominusculus xianensis]MBF0402353.1 class I SAM-dependent methyltransferase [Nitrospirota bacterium]